MVIFSKPTNYNKKPLALLCALLPLASGLSIPKRADPDWQNLGCYLDNVNGRALTGDGYTDDQGMTQENCQSFCDDKGFVYAGIEYAQECYCGNKIQNGGAPADDGCTMACKGDADEMCGGPNRLNVFWTGVTPPAAPVATPEALPQDWESLGCYSEGTNGRGLTYAAGVDGPLTTVKCLDACVGKGYTLAGLEYSQECYCGNTWSNGAAPADDGCTMKCKGNDAETCGGPNRLTAYQFTGQLPAPGGGDAPGAGGGGNPAPPAGGPVVLDTYGDWSSIGCYSEGTGGRTLGYGAAIDGDVTVGKCLDACHSKGYEYAGLEYAGECYCGNSFTLGGAPATDGCTMACKGDAAHLCGGANRLNAYHFGGAIDPPDNGGGGGGGENNPGPVTGPTELATYGEWNSLGCYSEGNGGRTLGVGTGVDGDMTVQKCLDACQAKGYPLAGLEYSGECYCGTAFQFGGAEADDGCTMPCKGDATELCGGANRLNAYTFTGTITTPPAGGDNGGDAPAPPAGGSANAVPVTEGLPEPWAYKGCYTEGQGARALGFGAPDNQAMTVQSCIDYCSENKYTVAGMEWGIQCFCGNALGSAPTSVEDTQCNQPCGGSATQACGQANRLSVYSSNATVTVLPIPVIKQTFDKWQYQGCYEEQGGGKPQIFKHKIVDPANQSIDQCLTLCKTYGYPAGGVEYGNECYCGDVEDVTARSLGKGDDTQCTFPCPGDPTTLCGAGNRLQLYYWTGTPMQVWNKPENPGHYEYLMSGPLVPLITTLGVNNKVTFLEKLGSGPQNSSHAYEFDYTISDPEKAFREMHVKSDMFCAAGVVLPDKAGRQLDIGGWALESTFGVRLYSPDGSLGVNGTNDWEENYSEVTLQRGRWYPGAMIMSNGSVLIVGGQIGANDKPEPTLELLPPPPGKPKPLFRQWLQDTDPNNLYPFLHVLPSGGIFIIIEDLALILDPVTFDTRVTLPTIPSSVTERGGRTYPNSGAAVMFPQHAPYTDPVTIMTCGGSSGGGAQAFDNCVSIDPDVDGAEWVLERMPFQRVMPLMTALPDGTYLITGGAQVGVAGFGLASYPTLTALLYDPSKPVGQRISILDTTDIARMYHSEAILLHDGRVLITGSDPLTTVLNEDGSVNEELSYPEEYRIQAYIPPYLSDGRIQPDYTIQETDWEYGGKYTITVTLPQGPVSSMRVSLLGAVVSTHGNNFGQRTIFPEFTCAGNSCTITAPPNNRIAPPGWFQLFVLDGPTPSYSQWVRIGGDPANIGNWPKYDDFTKPGV